MVYKKKNTIKTYSGYNQITAHNEESETKLKIIQTSYVHTIKHIHAWDIWKQIIFYRLNKEIYSIICCEHIELNRDIF